MKLAILLVPATLLAAAGCSSNSSSPSQAGLSGASGSAGSAATSCGDPTLAVDPTALIDDMESPAPRIGDTSTASVRLNVSDQYSNDSGGICDKTVASGDTACYDHFGVSLDGLDVIWKQYRIPFGGLSQLGFGIPRPSLDTASLYSIAFLFPVSSVFDFWVRRHRVLLSVD